MIAHLQSDIKGPLFLLLCVVALLCVAVRDKRRKRGTQDGRWQRTARFSLSSHDKSNFASRNILSNSEKQVFMILVEALPECYVFPQVSFNALITHASWIRHQHWQRAVRQKFNTKYVDFVLCRKADLEVVAVVEFDGTHHSSHDDEQRDRLLVDAGYRVERFKGRVTSDMVKARFVDLRPAIVAHSH